MKILIATTNKDKYKIVTFLLKKAGLDQYEYFNLKDIRYVDKDEKENGTIQERAFKKAKSVFENLNQNDFDYIIGIDDGIELKEELQANVKEYVNKILFENFLENGEKFAFYRAYSVVRKDGKEFTALTINPYKYKENNNVVVNEHSYPLSQISVPLTQDKPLCELSEDINREYTWNNSKVALIEMVKKMEGKSK